MAYPELVWTALVIIGGFLLIGDASQLSRQGRVGMMVIFAGFLVQVYWQILHQTEMPPVTWNLLSQIGVIYVTVLVVVLLLFGYPGPLARRKKQERVSEVGGEEEETGQGWLIGFQEAQKCI
jgi:apolipoprotein N-acyltransferase